MIPNNASDEVDEANEQNQLDRRSVEQPNKDYIADKLAGAEADLDASSADQALIDAMQKTIDAVRESEHIQTGDDQFDTGV